MRPSAGRDSLEKWSSPLAFSGAFGLGFGPKGSWSPHYPVPSLGWASLGFRVLSRGLGLQISTQLTSVQKSLRITVTAIKTFFSSSSSPKHVNRAWRCSCRENLLQISLQPSNCRIKPNNQFSYEDRAMPRSLI